MNETTSFAELGILFPPGQPRSVRLKWGCTRIQVESPVFFRGGMLDIDEVGAYTYMGGGVSQIRHVKSIGRFCSIASNLNFGATQHPTGFLSAHPLFQGSYDGIWSGDRALADYYRTDRAQIDKSCAAWDEIRSSRFGRIEIGSDVWIGEGVMIGRGIRIGHGAVVAGHSVVTKDVPPFAVVGGTPAVVRKLRFPERVCEELLKLSWWDYGFAALAGVDITKPNRFVGQIQENIARGIPKFEPRRHVVTKKFIDRYYADAAIAAAAGGK